MDYKSSRQKESFIDLESGTNAVVGEQERAREDGSLHMAWGGSVRDDGLIRDQEVAIPRQNSSSSIESSLENGEGLRCSQGEDRVGFLEKKAGAEKPRKKGCKKPPKPPRPPKSPSLDVADQKIVREMSELAVLKRARMERMKTLKKLKNAKTVSNNSNLCALLITVLFCFVILWQALTGVFSKGASNVGFQGSPESSVGTSNGFISVQFYRNVSTSGPHGSRSASPNIVEQVSGMDGRVEAHRMAG